MTYTIPTRDELVLAAQLLDAELSALDLYDNERSALGHDYGNGQRFAELGRVRRDRDNARQRATRLGYGMGLGELHATKAQCTEAFRTIAKAKLRRYERDAHLTDTQRRALIAWRKVGEAIEAMD